MPNQKNTSTKVKSCKPRKDKPKAPKDIIMITVQDGKITLVAEWRYDEVKRLLPFEIYLGHPLKEGVDYGVFYLNRPKEESEKEDL